MVSFCNAVTAIQAVIGVLKYFLRNRAAVEAGALN